MEKKVRWFRKAKQKAMGDAQKSKQMATKARTVAKRAMGKALKMKQVAKREPEAAKKDLPEEKTCSPAPAAEAENTAGAVTQLPSGTTVDDGAAETDAGGPPASGTPPPLLLPESTPSDDSELPAAAAPEAEPQAIPTMATAGGTPSREVTTTAVDHGAAETGAAAPPAPVTKAVLPAVLVPQVARQALPVPVAAVHVGAAVQGSTATAVTSRATEKAPSAPLVGAELQRVERLREIIALKFQQKLCVVTNDMSYRVRSDFAEQRRELAIKIVPRDARAVRFDGEAEAEYQAQVAARASVSAPESGNGAKGRGESERTSSAAHETAAEVASGKPDLTMSDLPPPSLPQQDPAPPHFGDSVMSGTEEAPVVPGGGETVAGGAAMPAFALPGVALPGLVLPATPPVDQPALIVPRAARAPANLFMPRRTQLRPSRLSIELTRAADEPMHDAPGDETVYDRDGDQAMEEAQGGDAETVEGGDETMPDAHDEEAGDDAAMDTSG
ncbi:hypothetical protein LTR54_014779 [Friedmanniomyces endolithicus]|nr:hypothetical protein LTR54_014779 [Friedmanniomyces endolithicus]